MRLLFDVFLVVFCRSGDRGRTRRMTVIAVEMKRLMLLSVALATLAFAVTARATHHTWEIVEIYSNADGTVQFVMLREGAGLNGQNLLAGQTLTVTHAGRTKTFTFPSNLPSTNTAARYVLIATQGYVDLEPIVSEFGAVPADYVIPNQFIPTDGGTLNYAAVDQVSFGPLPTDGTSALYTPVGPDSYYIDDNYVRNFSTTNGGVLPALAVTAVEYYNRQLDHYFISNLQPDIDALDTGRLSGWQRTGGAFYVFASPISGWNPVCRFYIPPEHGSSHFFSASPAECADVAGRVAWDPNYSGYIEETDAAFYVTLPNAATGACPANTIPVYRLWNGRVDSNHRYTTDPNVRAQMVARGYVAEGYGPNAVAMCTPG